MGRGGEREAGRTSGEATWAAWFRLGWVSFLFLLFYFLFQTPLKLFEFKFKFEFNPSTQTKRSIYQHECNNKF